MKLAPAISCLCATAAAASCDVSTPSRFKPDGSTGACAPLFQPGEKVYADLSCAQPMCPTTILQDGCALTIRVDTCHSLEVTAMLSPDQDPVFEPSTTSGTCTPLATAKEARLSFGCLSLLSECRVDLYPSVDRSDQFTLTPLVITPRPFRPQRPEAENALTNLAPLAGWLGGAATFGDHLVVATHGNFEDPRCISTSTASFTLIDLDTFTITATVAAPTCPIDLVADPQGDGFIAGYGGKTPSVGIFDANGALVKSATITVEPGQYITDVEIAGNELYVLISSDESTSFVTRLRLPDLTVDQTSLSFEHRARAILPLRPAGLAISDGARMGIRLLDDGLGDYGVLQLLSVRASSNNPGALSFNADHGLVLASSTGSEGAIWVLDPFLVSDAIRGQGVHYERLSVPWAIAPFEATTMLAGLTTRDEERDALLAIFEIDGAHFLPGTLPLGRGVVRSLLQDGRGNYYAVLPWEARVVRIEPRR